MLGDFMSVSVSVRRVAAAALTVVAVAGVSAVPASAAGHGPRPRAAVQISSVHYDSPGRHHRSNLNNEWVDVTNTTRRPVDLDRWTLSDRDGRTYTFHHYRLAGRATVRVHTGIGRDTFRDLFQDRRSSVWDRRGDTATLRNDHRRLVDTLSWGGHRGGHH
ncbi:lamin tail domain-containing protein [Streptomyces sp. NPDC048489]|uniref:lamin tail domain-containing protein n=1 Tax=Streptomyces sp. NPDC048489 TaxID=3154504 RepID=UPI0034403A15